MPFACRVRVLLRQGYLITRRPEGEDSFRTNFPFDGRVFILEAHEGETLRDFQSLIITTKGFASEDEASQYGRRIKKALLTYGVHTRIAIDVGNDQPEDDDWPHDGLLHDIHGLLVYKESDEPLILVSGGGASAQGVSVRNFVEGFVSALEFVPKLTDKQSLAIEIYNLAHFEASLNARFLTLITAVECLVEENKRSNDVLGFVDELKNYTEKRLKNTDHSLSEKFQNWLDLLKNESIRQSCKSLVSVFLDKESARVFDKHYSTRSALVHSGSVPKNVDLNIVIPELDDLVSRLIYRIITSG